MISKHIMLIIFVFLVIIAEIIEPHFEDTKHEVPAKLVCMAFYTLSIIVFIVMMFI